MATRVLDDVMSKSGSQMLRGEASMVMSSVINTTHLATVTFPVAFKAVPNVRNIGTDSSLGIMVGKGVQTVTTSQIVLGFRTYSPSNTIDATITVYADVEGII